MRYTKDINRPEESEVVKGPVANLQGRLERHKCPECGEWTKARRVAGHNTRFPCDGCGKDMLIGG